MSCTMVICVMSLNDIPRAHWYTTAARPKLRAGRESASTTTPSLSCRADSAWWTWNGRKGIRK